MAAALKRGKCAAQAFVILICIILCFALACNLTFIVKGALSPERPPSVSGMTPMVVLFGSGERPGWRTAWRSGTLR